MKVSFTFILLLVFYINTLLSCSGNENDNTPESWLGRYTYREPADSNNIIISRELIINRLNGEYLSFLNVSSATGNSSYAASVSVSNGELFVVFEKSFSKPLPLFQKGDTLFSLEKKSARLKTKWKKLSPESTKNSSGDCSCFAFQGLNENSNNISLP